MFQLGAVEPVEDTRMFKLESPFLRGILGGIVGMTGILLIAMLAYQGYLVWTDHQALSQVIPALNDLIKAANRPAP